ncbi:MAG: response regulator, partial [Sulfurimonadaceae bacterium]|nr:response regulator [Sulfurimonadaceae bacterium]
MPDSENKHAITLLYVEDDDQVRDTMTSILSDEVETVYSAADGQEGLELFQKHPVDLVITDIKMPRMDGLQMSEAIRREADHTPIIVTTAFSDSDVLLDAIEVQVDKFLLKPIRMRQLLGEVSKFAKQIESVRLLREEQYRAAQYLEAIDIGSGVVRFGNDYVISHTNEIFCEMASIKCDNLIGKMVGDLFGEEQQQRLGEILSEYERYEGVASVTVNGYERRMILSCVPIRNERREVEEYVLFVNDLTDYLQMKEQLITNLYTDPLTGLPNLRRLKQRLQIEKPEAMGMVHIDRIGHINNVYGREAGDQVITQMVELLQGHCGDDREVFRIEGDKFAIIP